MRSYRQKTLRASAHQFIGNAFKVYDKRHNYFKSRIRFQTAYFEIRDTGCGIAEADLERIFNPFERAAK
ncbi:ATP-binding protein [Acinetobacter baumannii]